MNKITAIYTRVSSNEQAAEGYGLDSQEEQCRAYANLVLRIHQEDIKLFVDDGYSAKNLKRPRLNQMLSMARAGEIERIIIYKLDRLSRSVVDMYTLLKELLDINCGLISVLDQLDISTANGRLVIGVLSIIAQWEREVISERTRAALEVMVKKGIYPYGLPPYGWKKNDNKQLIVDESKAALINTMADMLIDGASLTEIRTIMNREYGQSYSKDIITKYLKQEANIGVFKRDGIIYYDIIPPIMSVEKYNEIQKYLQYREHRAPDKTVYTFHSLVYCDDCKVKMNMTCTVKKLNTRDHQIYYYYMCPKCGHMVNQAKIKRTIFLSIFMESESYRITSQSKILKKELERIKKKEQSISYDYLEGSIPNDVFKKLIKEISEKKASITASIKCLKLKDPEFLNNSDKVVQYELVHNMVKKIYIHDHKVVNIEYKEK